MRCWRFGRAPEGVQVAAHQPDLLVGTDPAGPLPRGESRTRPVWHGGFGGAGVLDADRARRAGRAGRCRLELLHAGPAGVDALLVAVLLRLEPARRRLDPHRQVLGHDRHVAAFVGEVLGHRQDAGVVVAEPEARGQRRWVGVVELDAEAAPGVTDGDGPVEAPLADAQVVEQPQRLPGEVAELRVVAFALQLGHDDDGEHDLVLGETHHRPRVRQQHGGVDDVGLACLAGVGACTAARAGRRARGGGRRGGRRGAVVRGRALRCHSHS